MVNYDISTIEKCYKTMEEMTGFQYWKDIFDIYLYRYIDEPDLMMNEIMRNKKIHIRDIKLSDINFVLMHVTTSADKCKGIEKNGLHDLVWSYEHETELRSFLDAYNIDIDIGNKKICVEGVAHEISNDIKKSGGVGYKFFDDPYVCGCFQMRKDSPYGGNVHLRPEIIYNINKLVKGADLEYSWMNTHQPYIVKFRVSYNKMMIFLSESASSSKDKILKTLFNAAFYTVFYNDFSSDRIGILKLGEYVPASDVISIEDY